MKPSREDWRIGAIYRVGHRRQMTDEWIVAALMGRLGFSEPRAKRLVAHWLTSLPYRLARGRK
jgi:hypothetical protein